MLEKLTVEPYRIVFDNDWYLRGYAPALEGMRSYKITRMFNLELLDETYKIQKEQEINIIGKPWDFDGGEPQKVVIDFDRCLRQYMEEKKFHPSQTLEDINDKAVRYSFKVKTPKGMVSWILSLGSKAKVIEPEFLKDKVVDEAGEVQGLYP